jgi:uncharacterized protein
MTTELSTPWTDVPDAPSAPRHRDLHFFDSEAGAFLFLVNGSRIFRTSPKVHSRLSRSVAKSEEALGAELARMRLDARRFIDDTPPDAPRIHALSLAVAQKCNLGCTYCYAKEGDFGGRPQNMPPDVALRSVDLLFRDAQAGDTVSLAFLGGEPLLNRAVIHAATQHAVRLADEKSVQVRFAITTNATLLEMSDAEFLEQHGFSVTISLDGVGEIHDRQRPFKGGAGSFDRIMTRVLPLLDHQRQMQVSARVTVTPQNLELPDTLETFINLGFHSVGFSPLLHSPAGRGLMHAAQLAEMLEKMLECGRRFETAVIAGRRYPFANAVNAMREIHSGTHRPYPCGAGAGYFGVSAKGGLYACHRFVNDEAGALGDIQLGVDRGRQNRWLANRHVHWQEPCSGCWARYLCGGGCHHEVMNRGRSACDFIRGWLHYCLEAYTRLLAARPDYFTGERETANSL